MDMTMEAKIEETKSLFLDFMSNDTDDKRRSWIMKTLQSFNIQYEEQPFLEDVFSNIVCKGSSKVWLSAHFDTVNIQHCANDNSASIINLIQMKRLNPDINVVFLDAEEPPYFGLGSETFSDYLHGTNQSDASVWNLELTGFGNQIVIGSRGGITTEKLFNHLNEGKHDFKVSYITTPFSDTDVFLENQIDSSLLMVIPTTRAGEREDAIMFDCHTSRDTVERINFSDMTNLVAALSVVFSEFGSAS